MNFIVAMLLMYMDQEAAFWMLVVVMQTHKMVGLFQVRDLATTSKLTFPERAHVTVFFESFRQRTEAAVSATASTLCE